MGTKTLVEIDLGLSLPRDELSIPLVRHLCHRALQELGVTDECAADITVALTEACTNVLVHSGPADEYAVRVSIDGERCVLRIVDTGHGFDAEQFAGGAEAAPSAESGRGIQLMRALVDRVMFVSKPEDGTVVHLEKDLELAEDAPIRKLASAR